MNGWRRGDVVIHVGYLSNRKRPALAIGTRYTARKIASFNSKEDAEEFCDLMNEWLGLEADSVRGDDTN